ncbi:MAG: hypothetical protein IT237_04370 [Bacteroidia bacterium]|nr:hypothetical protein [Bacteroidia bacterium]
MIKNTKKESLSSWMHVIKCQKCGAILSSASERYLLPQFSTCDCDEPFINEPQELKNSNIKN